MQLFFEDAGGRLGQPHWSQARQMLRQALTAPGRSVWETLVAIAAMAEVDWGEGDGVTAARLLGFVVAQTATAASTRQRAEDLLRRMGEFVATACATTPLPTLEAACQLALRSPVGV